MNTRPFWTLVGCVSALELALSVADFCRYRSHFYVWVACAATMSLSVALLMRAREGE
jgi:hypothetical protein